MDSAEVYTEINTGLRTTLDFGFGGNHSLCHGDLGNIDILLEASNRLGEPAWRAHAEQIAAKILHNNMSGTEWVCGNPAGIESPGLMTGLAGIGYGLLRLADPTLPCLLALA